MHAEEPLMLSDDVARTLTESPDTVWYHRFRLSPGVYSPGRSNVQQILDAMSLPTDLTGLTVLDIGTIDGGFAFESERRGASRVVATEFRESTHLPFAEIAAAIGSRVELVHATVYELPALLDEQFDLVFFRGALYHLRHPLLGIEAVRKLARDRVVVETAVSLKGSGAEFYPGEYRGDSNNWFIPSKRCVIDWFDSSGFATSLVLEWPQGNQGRALFDARVLPRAAGFGE